MSQGKKTAEKILEDLMVELFDGPSRVCYECGSKDPIALTTIEDKMVWVCSECMGED